MIQIPPDATFIRDRRLTLIKILSSLTAKKGRLDQLKDEVKQAMIEKKATHVESTKAVGVLRGRSERQFVDPVQLYALIKKGRITLEQFLSVLCVRTSLMPKILSGDEIAAISAPADDADESTGSLWTDFKPDVKVDWVKMEEAMIAAL